MPLRPDQEPVKPGPILTVFSVATSVGLAGYGFFVYSKVPHDYKAMMVVPESLWMLALIPLIFLAIGKLSRKTAIMLSTWLSAGLWIASIALAFVIKPSSAFLPIPDGLLLSGFFPLLFLWRWSWPWIIVGTIDIAIGYFLLAVTLLADNLFPPDLVKAKSHLRDYHEPLIWLTLGYATFGYGAARMIKNIFLWCKRKASNKKQDTSAPPEPTSG